LIWSLYALLVAAVGGMALIGWKGAAGAAAGVVIADFEVLTLGMFSHVLLAHKPGPRVTRLCLVFLVLKLPVLVVSLVFASRLGTAAVLCFLGGMALVYSAMVHVAVRGAAQG
jgi:hypothetical protein